METGVAYFESHSREATEQQEDVQLSAPDRESAESISFGRFSLDPFSWVKRSSFNHNQYLEEVENCSSAGSVAQKKAYFEAYYKDFAKKKALEQEQALAEGSLSLEALESEQMDDRKFVAQNVDLLPIMRDKKDETDFSKAEKELRETVGGIEFEESFGENSERKAEVEGLSSFELEVAPGALERQSSEEKEKLKIPCEEQPKEGLNHEEQKTVHETVSNKHEDQPTEMKEANLKTTRDAMRQSNQKMSSKGSSVLGAQRKAGLNKITFGPNLVQKSSDLASGSTKVRTSHSTSGTMKEREGAPKRAREMTSTSGAKARNSHRPHVGSSRSNFTVPQPFALATDRRASLAGLPTDREVSRQTIKPRVSRKEERKVLGDRMTNVISDRLYEVLKTGKAKAVQPGANGNTFNFKSDIRAERRKEFNSKLEERLTAKEVEKNQAQAKTKQELQAEIRQLRKSLNFKATPMPTFYQESTPPKLEIKKIPPTRAKSPKLGRKNNAIMGNADAKTGGSCQPGSLDQNSSQISMSGKSWESKEHIAETKHGKETDFNFKKAIKKAPVPNVTNRNVSTAKPFRMPEIDKLNDSDGSLRCVKDSAVGEHQINNLAQGSSVDESSGQVDDLGFGSPSAQSKKCAMMDEKGNSKRSDQSEFLTTVGSTEEPANISGTSLKVTQGKQEIQNILSSGNPVNIQQKKGYQASTLIEKQHFMEKGTKTMQKETKNISAPVVGGSSREHIRGPSPEQAANDAQEPAITTDVALAS